MKATSLYVFFILIAFSCTPKKTTQSGSDYSKQQFEYKEINQNFRDSIGTNYFIKLEDGFTYYELGGPESGEVIVLVHGYSVPSYIWDSTYTAAIDKGYRVLRYDAFGRGFSDRPEIAYDINLSYRQLSGLIDSLGLSVPLNLVGLSWGGRVVSYYTALNPSKIKKLVMVDPSGFEPVAKIDSTEVEVSKVEVTKFLKERAPRLADSQLGD